MSQRTTVTLPDELYRYAQAHANGNMSGYLASLIEREQAAEMWSRSEEELRVAGLTDRMLEAWNNANTASQLADLRESGAVS